MPKFPTNVAQIRPPRSRRVAADRVRQRARQRRLGRLETSEQSAALSACAPQYTVKAYNGGDTVQNHGSNYQCKPYPFSGWCGIAGAYEPGVGSAWQDAWTALGACGGFGRHTDANSDAHTNSDRPPNSTEQRWELRGVGGGHELRDGRGRCGQRQGVHRDPRQPRLRSHNQHLVLVTGSERLRAAARQRPDGWDFGRREQLRRVGRRHELHDRHRGLVQRQRVHRDPRQPWLRPHNQHLVLVAVHGHRLRQHNQRWRQHGGQHHRRQHRNRQASGKAGSVPAAYLPWLQQAAGECAFLDAPHLAAQIDQESRWDPNAVSRSARRASRSSCRALGRRSAVMPTATARTVRLIRRTRSWLRQVHVLPRRPISAQPDVDHAALGVQRGPEATKNAGGSAPTAEASQYADLILNQLLPKYTALRPATSELQSRRSA